MNRADIDRMVEDYTMARTAVQRAVNLMANILDWSDSGPEYVRNRSRLTIGALEDCAADLDRLRRVVADIDLSKGWRL